MNKMLRFTDTGQHYPDTAPADERRRDFDEIYSPFDPAEAARPARRAA